ARPAAAPDGEAGRPMARGRLGAGLRRGGARPEGARLRRARLAARDARGALPRRAARPGGFPPAPLRLLRRRRARRDPVAPQGGRRTSRAREGIPGPGMPIAELGALDRVLVVGSFLREEAPLIAHRLRQAAKRGAQVHMLHSIDDDWLMPVASKTIVPPSGLVGAIGGFQEALKSGKNAAVLIGNFAQRHP